MLQCSGPGDVERSKVMPTLQSLVIWEEDSTLCRETSIEKRKHCIEAEDCGRYHPQSIRGRVFTPSALVWKELMVEERQAENSTLARHFLSKCLQGTVLGFERKLTHERY